MPGSGGVLACDPRRFEQRHDRRERRDRHGGVEGSVDGGCFRLAFDLLRGGRGRREHEVDIRQVDARGDLTGAGGHDIHFEAFFGEDRLDIGVFEKRFLLGADDSADDGEVARSLHDARLVRGSEQAAPEHGEHDPDDQEHRKAKADHALCSGTHTSRHHRMSVGQMGQG